GDYENDDWSTDLTLADGATFEWTFGGGGQNYLNVEGGFVNIAGGLTLRLKGGAGSASGEDVSLIKSLFGVVIDPEQVTVEAPDGWTWGTLPSGAPDMVFNGQYLVLRNLTAFAVTLPGDANGDGDVNDADLALFEAQFGEAGAGQTADFDGDGDVDLDDFVIIRENFGFTSAPQPAAPDFSATPEPAAMILLAAGFPVLFRRRRKI
ncbi:MAG: hypothetical protein QGH94_08675, partial [Phycisphaerae bacterium]|nr:hypothetical protein [Phycisphaerae bacterium]